MSNRFMLALILALNLNLAIAQPAKAPEVIWLSSTQVRISYTLPRGYYFSCVMQVNPGLTFPAYCSQEGVSGVRLVLDFPRKSVDANYRVEPSSSFYVDAYTLQGEIVRIVPKQAPRALLYLPVVRR